MTDQPADDLRAALRQLVPDPPAVPDRAAASLGRAHRRRRRRTTAVALGATAAVAAVSVVVAVLGSGSPRPEPAVPTPTATPSTAESVTATDPACPEPLRRGDPYPDYDDPRPLPEGATVARLCPIAVPSYGGFQAPADALVTGVDALIATINALPEDERAAGDRVCTAEGGLSYLMVLGYPDGPQRVVHGSLVGCEWLDGAGPQRTDASIVWRAYLGALRAQRQTTTPPRTPPPTLSCPGNGFGVTSPMARTADATHALLCWRRTDIESESGWASAPISEDDLRSILADLADPARDAEVSEQDCLTATLQLDLVGTSAWGDISHTSGDCGAFYVDGARPRRLGPRAQEIVDALVTSHPGPALPEPSPSMRPGEILNLWVDLLNEGRLDEARRLVTDPTLVEVNGRLDVKAGSLTEPSVSPGPEYASYEVVAQSALYRVVPPDGSFVDYRDAEVVMLRRDDRDVWRIAAITEGDVVGTGR
ncbi:MAG: hypothetical protein M3237_13140 [Actinomycetota bacterium]|nr:hypothetical protein [Actinomycetota bacterium]